MGGTYLLPEALRDHAVLSQAPVVVGHPLLLIGEEGAGVPELLLIRAAAARSPASWTWHPLRTAVPSASPH